MILIPIASYIVTFVALALLTLKVRELLAIYRKQQPDPTRSAHARKRLGNMAKEVLGHTKMLNFTGTGIAHWFVMIGFFSLVGTLVTAFVQVLKPDFALPIIGHFVGYELFVELIAATTGLGIVTLIGIRQVTKRRKLNRFRGSSMGQAYYVEATILGVVFCVISLRGLEGALNGEQSWNWHYAISWPAVLVFKSLSVQTLKNGIVLVAGIKILISMAWFIVIASNLTMGIAWHRFLAFFNIYYKRNISGPALGGLPDMLSKGKPVNFEDPEEGDVFGLGARADITWKGLLDMTSCTECGRCQSQCPAWHTDKPLSPKLLIMAIRDHAMAKTVETESLVDEKGAITKDILWSCTSCGACVNECPVDIEHVDHVVNMRRFQVLVESEFPNELGGVFRNLEKSGNPWGSAKQDRESWISECDFPVQIVTDVLPDEIEYLFWVGCAGAYEDRAKKTTKAVAELLHMADVKFAVLGKKETCTGDPARRTGNELLYQILSQENIQTLNEVFEGRSTHQKKVVVTCPHCFTTIGRDYANSGIELEMIHHTQLLNTLIKEGRLKPSPHKSEKKMTYHDPCYLGRHNQIYAPPRELLSASGCDITEMTRNQERSFCCGGGGGRMWMEEKIGTRISQNRSDEAVATGAQEVAVACPFCRVMIGDGVAASAPEVEVLDVAQILLRSVKASNS